LLTCYKKIAPLLAHINNLSKRNSAGKKYGAVEISANAGSYIQGRKSSAKICTEHRNAIYKVLAVVVCPALPRDTKIQIVL